MFPKIDSHSNIPANFKILKKFQNSKIKKNKKNFKVQNFKKISKFQKI
jgi:hypothetical protein